MAFFWNDYCSWWIYNHLSRMKHYFCQSIVIWTVCQHDKMPHWVKLLQPAGWYNRWMELKAWERANAIQSVTILNNRFSKIKSSQIMSKSKSTLTHKSVLIERSQFTITWMLSGNQIQCFSKKTISIPSELFKWAGPIGYGFFSSP